MWKPKWSRVLELAGQPQSVVLLLLPGMLALTLYFLSSNEPELERIQYLVSRTYNKSVTEAVEGYLVWSPKCHMLSKSPLDPSITKYVKREKFEKCSSTPPLTSISRVANGTVYLTINPEQAKRHKHLSCCWAVITRPAVPVKPTTDKEFDSKMTVGPCEEFEERVVLDRAVETLLVRCRDSAQPRCRGKGARARPGKSGCGGALYENVHAVLNPERLRDRLNESSESGPARRQLSVLVLGIDSVSRLNLHRSMPLTRQHLEEAGWIELRGYNKMGDNTFPNLMAILTGHNQSTAYASCRPKTPYGLDDCSLIWHRFREAGYATAYGEDAASMSTFNYLKVGFVEPPTDFYLRPYVLAYEKLLKPRTRFGNKYCAGPELVFDRIFDYAVEFARVLAGRPSFGFFWSNSVSHEAMNGISAVDAHFRAKLRLLHDSGALDSSLAVLLSDHGMRFGEARNTFVGWYEERLPFIYLRLPGWLIEQNPTEYEALRANQNRLTSPFDLYETLRDVLSRAGGEAAPASGCLTCQSLLKPVARTRGCAEAGVSRHWCTCNAFSPADPHDPVVLAGAHSFADHMEGIVSQYRSSKGWRLCARPRLKRIHRVSRLRDLEAGTDAAAGPLELFYLIEITPGSGLFETTVRYHGERNYTINDQEVSRINLYSHSARCLEDGFKQYCHCT